MAVQMLSTQSRPSHTSSGVAGNYRLPMFGPLDIKNEKEFLKDAKAFFKLRSSSVFPYKLNLNNFDHLYEIGGGAFGRVILVKYKLFDKSYYAMKIMNKKSLYDKNLIEFALNEKRILQGLNHPFCIRLEYFTSDKYNIYYLLPYISGGELCEIFRKLTKLGENLAKFYAAQIVLGLEFIHYCDIIHRDIKPENFIVDQLGYLKMADFGLSKMMKPKLRAYTFCGTPEYIAPEIILGTPYSFAVDWWAVGVILFEFVNGQTPFYDEDLLEMYKKIVDSEYQMPSDFSPELKDLVTDLLQIDTSRRLGNLKRGVEDIKTHNWFKEIHWLSLLNRRIIPPFIPPILGDFDTGNFPHLKKLAKDFTTDSLDSDIDNNVFKDF